MFGFFSFLSMSSMDNIYINGQDENLILNIQQSNVRLSSIRTIITLDLTIERDEVIIL